MCFYMFLFVFMCVYVFLLVFMCFYVFLFVFMCFICPPPPTPPPPTHPPTRNPPTAKIFRRCAATHPRRTPPPPHAPLRSKHPLSKKRVPPPPPNRSKTYPPLKRPKTVTVPLGTITGNYTVRTNSPRVFCHACVGYRRHGAMATLVGSGWPGFSSRRSSGTDSSRQKNRKKEVSALRARGYVSRAAGRSVW